MHFQEIKDGYLVRLVRGEEIRSALSTLMVDHKIGWGFVTGIGAISDARLGFYNLANKSYVEHEAPGYFELVGLTGSLSWHEGEPFPHVHVSLADSTLQMIGGHCFEATTSATVELYVRAEKEQIDRELDDSIGLHLLQMPSTCKIRDYR